MFELVHPVVPSTALVTDDDLDQIERIYACRLPPDYRAFMTTIGPGTLDDESSTEILSPEDVIAQTAELRADAPDYLSPEDLDGVIVFSGDVIGDVGVLRAGDPPRYLALPHDALVDVRDIGPTLDDFFAYLDPRVRYEPRERFIVEGGVPRQTDGRPDGTPYIFPFYPRGFTLGDLPPTVEQEIVWGDSDDGLVPRNRARLGGADGDEFAPAGIDLQFHLEHNPLLALLRAIALRDPATRFEAVDGDGPEVQLTVPHVDAVLRARDEGGKMTLSITAPRDHAAEVYRWFQAEARALGYDAPAELTTLAGR